MPTTYNFPITLTIGNPSGSYPLKATQNVNVGDTVNVTIATSSNYSIVTETGGAPNLGANQATPASFAYGVTGSGGTTQFLYFFGSSAAPYYNFITAYRGKIALNIVSPDVCTQTTPTGTPSPTFSGSFSSTINATISGTSHGAHCSPEVRAATTIAGMPAFNPGLTTPTNLVRGTTYFFQVSNITQSGVVTSAAATAPFLAPYTAIGVGTAEVTSNSDGSWTQTITGTSQNTTSIFTNYAAVTNSGSAILLNTDGSKVSTGVNGTTMTNNNGDNTPSGATTTFKVYASRTSTSGGNGGQGFSGGSWHDTGVTFDVTRSAAHNESVTNASGTYFDNLTGTGAVHSVSLSGLSSGFYYNISKSSSNINTALSTWTSSSATTKTVTDTAAADPGSDNTTTTTYYLYRSANSNGSSPAYTGDSYTRTIASYSRLTMTPDLSVVSSNTVTQTVSNAINGHIYYIKSPQGAIVGQATASSNGNLNISVTVGANDIPNVGNSVVHTLFTQSSFNSAPTTEFSTGQTYTLTRGGTSSGGVGASSSTYGLEVFTASGTLLYGTTSRVGRVMASGRIPASGTIANGVTETVDTDDKPGLAGLADSTAFNITVLPEVGGTGGVNYSGFQFTLTKGTNQFSIKNESGFDNAYNYVVLKTGGT